MRKQHVSFVAKDRHIEYSCEPHTGDILRINSAFTGVGNSSIGVLHRMCNIDGDLICATMKTTLVQIDNESRRSVQIPDWARKAIEDDLMDVINEGLGV